MNKLYKNVMLVSMAHISTERPPPGLAFLAGICESVEVEYNIFDLNIFLREYFTPNRWEEISILTTNLNIADDLYAEIEKAINCVIDNILSFNLDLLALTSFSSMQLFWTEQFLKQVRERTNITIIAGGPGISYEQEPNKTFGKLLAEKNLLDYYVLGEGDIVFKNFLSIIIALISLYSIFTQNSFL
jgi:hypothetical protein